MNQLARCDDDLMESNDSELLHEESELLGWDSKWELTRSVGGRTASLGRLEEESELRGVRVFSIPTLCSAL